MQKRFRKLPPWMIMVLGFLGVAVVGGFDFLTGDYSLLIFYAIPVALISWFVGRWGGVAISISAGITRLVSDYFSYADGSLRYWNSLQDMVFLLMLGLLIALVKKLMLDEQRPLDD